MQSPLRRFLSTLPSQLQHVRISTANGIATVAMDRPEVHNAFNETAIGELRAAMDAVSARDSGIRCVILTGEGPSFSAGGDLNYMHKMVDATKVGSPRGGRDARRAA